MSKQVYISADYSIDSGDRDVVNILNQWGSDCRHKVDFIDMAKVVSGSVSEGMDCRPCDLKEEFNRQIKASSTVIFVVGDKTAYRMAGSGCSRATNNYIYCNCTPYKKNTNGTKPCKVLYKSIAREDGDVGSINSYSYLRHEFEEAKKRGKIIVVVYNSLRKEANWLPIYMKEYEIDAQPFWIKNDFNEKVGNYDYIKEALGYD